MPRAGLRRGGETAGYLAGGFVIRGRPVIAGLDMNLKAGVIQNAIRLSGHLSPSQQCADARPGFVSSFWRRQMREGRPGTPQVR